MGIALAACTIAAPALAEVNPDRCNDILKFGTFDTSSAVGSASYQRAFRHLVCTERFSSSNSSGGLGIVYEGIPVNFSLDSSNESYRRFCSDQSENVSHSSEWNNFVSTASQVIASSWIQCMELRARADTSQGLGQQLLTFTTRQFEDPALFEI